MGSLQLDCPLCCNETFTSQQSLKYHLLSIIDNILCSICSCRFETIYELTKHLDEDCSKPKPILNKKEEPLSHFESVQIKIENDDSSDDLSNSILAKALLSPQKNTEHTLFSTAFSAQRDHIDENNDETSFDTENNVPDGEDGTDENSEEIYSCSSCGVSFTALEIEDHIKKYHADHDVVVETQSNENEENSSNLLTVNADGNILTNLPEGATIIASDGVVLNDFEGNFDEEADSNESQELSEGSSTRVRMPQILNTLKQEECTDKDGRLYTRKVVQIEKFWDEEPEKLIASPMILKYLVNDEGLLVKINDDQDISDEMQIVEMYQCNNCGVQFSKRDQYDIHSCDPEIGSEYKCSMCDSSFTNSNSLSYHMKTHKTKKGADESYGPFICGVCSTVFPTNKSLRLHKRMHDPIKTKEIDAPVEYGLMGNDVSGTKPREMFECKVCGKKYDKSYEQMHMAYHSGVNHYDCYICNRKFYTHSNLEMHMRVHGNEKGHTCHQCKKVFNNLESLNEHLKQHCNTRPYQCSYCSRRFARPHEKVKHERIHTGEKPHECEICGKTFRVSYCLTLHMRTHSGFRPYVCQHCGKRFKAHSVYNHHLLTHSDVRAYKCPYCPKAFKTGVQLAGHKNSHTKPFSCTECNRPFASLYAVRAHMETHKRENNLKYNCYLCGASYARAFALRDHIREQHTDAPQNGNVSLDIIEEGMEATTSILPENDITMVSLEEIANVSDMEDESNDQ